MMCQECVGQPVSGRSGSSSLYARAIGTLTMYDTGSMKPRCFLLLRKSCSLVSLELDAISRRLNGIAPGVSTVNFLGRGLAVGLCTLSALEIRRFHSLWWRPAQCASM